MATKIGFDYSSISAADQKLIAEHIKAITSRLRQSIHGTIDIGRRLKLIYDILGTRFKIWADAEFEWSYATALNYMGIADRFGDLDCLDYFHQSSLIVFLPSRVPQVAIDRAIELARSGQMVSKKRAEELVNTALVEAFAANPKTASISSQEAGKIGRALLLGGTSKTVLSLSRSVQTMRKNLEKIYQVMSEEQRKMMADELKALADELLNEPVIEGDIETTDDDTEFGEYSDDVNADAELATA